MKWQKRIFFMCKVIIMVRNDLTVGTKKAVLLKLLARTRITAMFHFFPITQSHGGHLADFLSVAVIKGSSHTPSRFCLFCTVERDTKYGSFYKKCHRDLFKHQQTDLNRPKSIGKALCKPRNKDRKNGNKDRNCCPYSRIHGKRHV